MFRLHGDLLSQNTYIRVVDSNLPAVVRAEIVAYSALEARRACEPTEVMLQCKTRSIVATFEEMCSGAVICGEEIPPHQMAS